MKAKTNVKSTYQFEHLENLTLLSCTIEHAGAIIPVF